MPNQGMVNSLGWKRWALMLAVALAIWIPSFARAVDTVGVQLSRLEAQAKAQEVVSGLRDSEFVPIRSSRPSIFEISKRPVWWKVTFPQGLTGVDEPQLILKTTYLTRVEAWLPGRTAPGRYAVYGEDADWRYSPRALVIPLPQRITEGGAVYLLLREPAAVPIAVSVAARDQAHREDLSYVQWRSAILCTMIVVSILAVGFWFGVGDNSFLFLAASMMCAVLFIAAMGGELRGLGRMALWISSPQSVRGIGCLGLLFANLFASVYLDLKANFHWIERALRILAYAAGALAAANFMIDASILGLIGNFAMILSAFAIFVAGVVMTIRGHRAARFLMLSWVPLLVVTVLRGVQMSGAGFEGVEWIGHAHPASFAIAGLALTVGMSDKLLQLRRDRDRASREANVDALTAALSRKAIEAGLREEVVAALKTGEPLSVAFVDIDYFKRVNDNHGHGVGDAFLRKIAQRVRNRLRARDLLGRYGGDELLVVMPGTSRNEAFQAAERLRTAVSEQPLSIEGMLLPASLSIGVAELRTQETVEQLLARADTALYASKAAGRDRATSDESDFLDPSNQPGE